MSKKEKKVSVIDELGLPELPPVASLGAYDPMAMSYKDANGRVIQGPGVKAGSYGIHLVCLPADTQDKERYRAHWRQRGYVQISDRKITCAGFEGAEIWYTSYERHLELEKLEDAALKGPLSGRDSQGVEFETTRKVTQEDLGDVR